MWYKARFYFYDRDGDEEKNIVDTVLIYGENRMDALHKASDYAEQYGYDDYTIDAMRSIWDI